MLQAANVDTPDDGDDAVSESRSWVTAPTEKSSATNRTSASRMTGVSSQAKSALTRHCKDMFGIDKKDRLSANGEGSNASRPYSSRRSLSGFAARDSAMAASAPGNLQAAGNAESSAPSSRTSSARLSVLPEEAASAPGQLEEAFAPAQMQREHSCALNEEAAALDAALPSDTQIPDMPAMPQMPQMPTMPHCTYGCSFCAGHGDSPADTSPADTARASEQQPPTHTAAPQPQPGGLLPTTDRLQQFNEQQSTTGPDIKAAVPSIQSAAVPERQSDELGRSGDKMSCMDDSAMTEAASVQGQELTQSEKGKQQLSKLVQRFANNDDKKDAPLAVLKRKHQFRCGTFIQECKSPRHHLLSQELRAVNGSIS